MGLMQSLLGRLLPPRLAQSMERESRAWMVTCSCGFARSVWEMGGVRWKAKGEPRVYRSCPGCGRRSWHRVVRRADEA